MTTLREAASLALEALDSDNPDIQLRAATALRAALAAKYPEPVGWLRVENYLDEDNLWNERKVLSEYDNGNGVPLYTTPPQREWQGLTQEEVRRIVQSNTDPWCDTPETDGYGVAEMVESKLREKNGNF